MLRLPDLTVLHFFHPVIETLTKLSAITVEIMQKIDRTTNSLKMAEGRGQRAEGRGQKAEGRGQRAEGKGKRKKGKGEREEWLAGCFNRIDRP
jgi:hypothetical protein